jgi:hypothetical protein
MKSTFAVFLLCTLVISTNVHPILSTKLATPKKANMRREIPMDSVVSKAPRQDLPCPVCVDFFDDSLNTLLNIILNLGVGAGCADLCSPLNDSTLVGICSILCFLVGFEAFVDLIENADLDSIYLCSEIDLCPANTCTGDCINITQVIVQPKKAPVRTTFNFNIFLHVLKATGTGVTRIVVQPPGQNDAFGLETLNEGFTAGTTLNVTLQIETDFEDWNYPPGLYQVEVDSCGSDCDNEHGVIFNSKFTSFTITQSGLVV